MFIYILFETLKHFSIYMFDVIKLSFSTLFRWPSVIATATLSNGQEKYIFVVANAVFSYGPTLPPLEAKGS